MLSSASPEKIPALVIRVENLWSGYPGRPVLKGISLEVRQGEFIGILGPNGSGKTTLLLTLSGIVPAQSGTVEVLGTPVTRLKSRERARRLAVVAQDGDVRFPFSCREVVRMGRYPHQRRWGVDSAGDEDVVERMMRVTDTWELAERFITELSGGERQRVFMAKALAQESPILLLDEATSAMDIHRKLEAFRLLDELNREECITILAILHDINLAALFCRRMVFINNGEVVADGPTQLVLTPHVLEKVYRTRVLVREIEGTGKSQVVFLP